MMQFKVGDKVTPVNAYCDNDIMEQFVGKTLLVISVGDEVVCAGVPGEGDWYWHSNDLRLVSEPDTDPEPSEHFRVGDYVVLIDGPEKSEEIEASKGPKRLRWGALVVCNGEIHMVFDDHPDDYGDYRVLCLTRDCMYSYMPAKELIKVGSIRKKIKRLKAQMGDGK